MPLRLCGGQRETNRTRTSVLCSWAGLCFRACAVLVNTCVLLDWLCWADRLSYPQRCNAVARWGNIMQGSSSTLVRVAVASAQRHCAVPCFCCAVLCCAVLLTVGLSVWVMGDLAPCMQRLISCQLRFHAACLCLVASPRGKKLLLHLPCPCFSVTFSHAFPLALFPVLLHGLSAQWGCDLGGYVLEAEQAQCAVCVPTMPPGAALSVCSIQPGPTVAHKMLLQGRLDKMALCCACDHEAARGGGGLSVCPISDSTCWKQG